MAKAERWKLIWPGGIPLPASLMQVCMATKTVTEQTFSTMPRRGLGSAKAMVIRFLQAGYAQSHRDFEPAAMPPGTRAVA